MGNNDKIKTGDKANLPILTPGGLACVDNYQELWMGTTIGNVLINSGGSSGLSSLIGEWHFDEESGLIAYDTSGYGYDGTLVNAPLRVTGKYGKALQFDETNKYVNCATTSSINFSNAFSIEFWFKTTMGGASNPGTILSKINNIPSGKGWAFLLYDHDPGCLSLFIQKDAANYKGWATTALFNDGIWHHAVGVKYPDNTIKIYVDGVETAGHYVEAGTVDDYSNSETIKIGAEGVVTHTFAGTIDEVRIYNRVLYASEIQEFDHGALSGLLDDDHTQYLPRSGIRAMLDTLDMGGYSVVNSPFVVGPLNNASTGMRGGLAFGAIVAAYGQDHLTKAGRIQMSVPNAAKSGWKDALHIDGVTDNPIVTIDGDLDMSNTHLLGHDIKNAQWIYGPSGDNGFVAMLGGTSNTNSAAVVAYGSNFVGANGAIYLSVPNAAKNAVLDVIDIEGATDSPIVNFHYPLKADTIAEKTANAGVTIDGLLIKDGAVAMDHGLLSGLLDDDHTQYLPLTGIRAMTGPLKLQTGSNAVQLKGMLADTLSVVNGADTGWGNILANGIQLEDVLYTDTIGEKTANAGVTIDGLLIKDGAVAMDHGLLSGLLDDDHTQYLPRSGIRAMLDTLDMGGYSVVNSPFVVGPLNNASTGMRGGLAFGAIVAAYGQDHLTKAGRIQMSVPNAAKSGWKDALHIDGVTDNPIVTIDGDLDMSNTHLLGHDIKNAQWIYGPSGDNGFVAMLGGTSNTNSAAVVAYGSNFVGANGAIYLSVPNAAKNAVLDVIDIEGATDSPIVNFHYPLKADTIAEKTANAGVTIDGLLIKDGAVAMDHGLLSGLLDDDHTQYLPLTGIRAMTGPLKLQTGSNAVQLKGMLADTLSVVNGADTGWGNILANGIQLEDVLYTDTIGEKTANAGVTIDGLLIKDGAVAMDHGLLSGLLDDDHTQYLPRSGIRAMLDTLDMGGYSVVNSPFVVGPLNNASTGMRGGLAFGAIVAAYGQDHLTKAGRIQMSVPNAAKSGWKDALHIDGVTDNPIVTIDGDLDMSNTHLLGHDIKNAQWIYGPSGDNGFVAMLGGTSNTNSAAVVAYGSNFVGANGAIYLSVPNAAKNAVLDVIDIEGATDTPVVNFHYPLTANQITEYTTDAGVRIEQLEIKDYKLSSRLEDSLTYIAGGPANENSQLQLYGKNHGTWPGDWIFYSLNAAKSGKVMAATIDGHTNTPKLNLVHGLKTDTIDEKTADAGVTIDGCLIKDGDISHPTAATIVVAASNSVHKEWANYTCSGSSDQTTINTAITAAAGGRVILLDGDYVTTNSINMASNTILEGQGAGTTITNNTWSNMVIFSGVTNAALKNVLLNHTYSDEGYPIRVYNDSENIHITKCHITNTGATGIDTGAANNVFFNNNVVSSRHSGYGFNNEGTGSLTNCYITNNIFLSNGIHSDKSGSTFFISGNTIAGTSYLYGNSHCIVKGNKAKSIYLTGSNNIIQNNICTGSGLHGIRIRGSFNQVIGNNCYNNTSRGIMVEGGDNNIITNNVCNSNGTDGIILYAYANNNVVSNNHCYGNTDVGIMLEEHNDNNTITGNYCYLNDKDGILLFQSSHNIIESNFCKDNGQDTLYSYSEIRIWGYSGVGSHYNLITGNKCRCTSATKCDYCVKEDLSIDDYNLIANNYFDGAAIIEVLKAGAHTVVRDNMGHDGVMDFGTF